MELGYHRMPRELCQGQDLNLERFSLGLSDESINYIVDTALLRIFDTLCEACPSTMAKRYQIMRVIQNSFLRSGLGTRQSKADIIRMSDGVKDDSIINESIRLWDETVSRYGLRCVNLGGAEKITNCGLDRLATVCKSLHWINLQNAQGITGKGLSIVVAEASVTLQHLNLSYCKGIAGAEFAVLGQHCKHLKTLMLTKCTQITSTSLRSIFQGCRELEDLDVSYCSNLTDDEIYSLRCENLKRISLKECNRVTDSGFQSLTKESSKLVDVDCTRGSMTHNFTDTSLMAFSEKCKFLRRLILKGCRLVSDLGISWLSQGCPNLEHLDLSGCVDLTNMAAAHLGERCHRLRILNLFGVKSMSDTALRTFSDGCQGLVDLDVSGLYLLTDGKKRNFGREGLQALGDSACSSTIKRLKLQGCFQIQTGALGSIAKLKELEAIDLSSCTKLTMEGLLNVAKSCPKLNSLNLSNCGSQLKDSMLEKVIEILHDRLEHINLARCSKVSSRTIKALALHSPNLRTLNLSECLLVTNEDLLFYCAKAYLKAHKLTHLDLSQCPKIGNDSLVVLARTLGYDDGAYFHTSAAMPRKEEIKLFLKNISLKGTAVTKAEARVVEKKFMRYSSLHCDEKFFGFRENLRAKDMKFVRHHLLRCMAKERLERRCCRYINHWKTQVVRRRSARARAAKAVQKAKRRHQAVAILTKLLNIDKDRNERATQIQSLARHFASTKILRQLKQCVLRANAERAARVLQKCVRQGMARERASIELSAKVERQNLERATSCTMQCFLRSAWSREELSNRRKRRQEKDEGERDASVRLQCRIRHVFSKRRLRELKGLKRIKDEREAFSANSIAITWYYYKLRKRARVIREKLKQEFGALIKLQKFSRKVRSIIELRRRQFQQRCRRQQECAITLQYFSRRLKAVSALRFLQQEQWEWEQRKLEKGPIIVHWCHYVRALCRAQLRKDEVAAFEKKLMEYQVFCATTISSYFWRRVLAKRRVKALQVERNGKWKHMWSEEHQRPFYYNQWTGEWRWRPPASMLEQQERPKCDNCDFFEAQMECASCREYFCQTCFSNVHSGGKRAAQHQFRALYNFYDKRIDYGDGVFPSIWPSETEEAPEAIVRNATEMLGHGTTDTAMAGASTVAFSDDQQHEGGGEVYAQELVLPSLHGGEEYKEYNEWNSHDREQSNACGHEYNDWHDHRRHQNNSYAYPENESLYHYPHGQQEAYEQEQEYIQNRNNAQEQEYVEAENEGLFDRPVSSRQTTRF